MMSPPAVNPALERSRGMDKIGRGASQIIERGNLPFIAYTLLPGGKLRKLGDFSTFKDLPLEVDQLMLKNLTRSSMTCKRLRYVDSKDMSTSTRNTQPQNTAYFPLLPNPISSKFWKQNWTKEYLTKVFKYQGYGQGGIPYGSGVPPRGYPDKFVIPYAEFTGPGGKPPTTFTGNYSDTLFKLLLSILDAHGVDGEEHVCDPPLGGYVPKGQRGKSGDAIEQDEVVDSVTENIKRTHEVANENLDYPETVIENTEPIKKTKYLQEKVREVAAVDDMDNVGYEEIMDSNLGKNMQMNDIEVIEVKEEMPSTNESESFPVEISEEPKECIEEQGASVAAEDDSQMSITIHSAGHDPVQITLNRTRLKKRQGNH